jgi:hypothetical protein
MAEKRDEEQLPLPIPEPPLEGELLPKEEPLPPKYTIIGIDCGHRPSMSLAITLALLAAMGASSLDPPRIERVDEDDNDE